MALVLRTANIHYVLDALGLTRIELPAKGKPKVKTVCAIDKKHASIHGWGAWTSASVAGGHAMISRGGHAGSATFMLCALDEMAEAAPAYTRDLRGYAGAVLVDDEHVLRFENHEGTPVAQILDLDPARKGGLGEVVQKLEVTGTTLAPAWTTPSSKQMGRELASFVRIASDGTWLAVSHTDKKAWGGKLRFAKKTWSLEHTFELPLACSTATRIDAACFDGLAMIELFDVRAGSAELAVIDVTGAPRIAHQLRIDTARPLALTANAVFACTADGDAIVRHALDGAAPRTIAAKTAIEGELFVIGERVFATARDRFGFVDVESGSVIDRKPPKPVTTVFGLHQLPYGIRPELFTLHRTEEVFRSCGARVELAGWRVDQPGAPSSNRSVCAIVDTFHDGGLLGCWLDAWVYGQRSRREYRVGDGKTYSFYTQLQRRAVAPSTEHDPDAVLAAFETLRTHGIGLHEVLHDRDWIVESPYRRRTRAALTPAAIGMLLRAWCSAATRGDLTIPPADELSVAPTVGDALAAIPKLLPLLIGADDGTLRSANGDGNIDHFIACAFAVLSPGEFSEVLTTLHAASESFERKRVRGTVSWVAKECGIAVP